MEIIQQKLIWLLGSASLMVVLLRLDLSRYIASKVAAIKLKTGISLMIWGTVVGILSRAGWLGDWIPQSGLAFYSENIIGYVLGWSLIIWGILDWSREHFDEGSRPLLNTRFRIFSEKISETLARHESAGAFLEAVSRDFLSALDCQALAYHRQEVTGDLRLNFHDGLLAECVAPLAEPDKRSLIQRAIEAGKPLNSDEPESMPYWPETSSGQTQWAYSRPIIAKAGMPAALTFFSVKPRQFNDEELKLLEIASNALSAIMCKEALEADIFRRDGLDDVCSQIDRNFKGEASLVSGLLRSSRAIYEFLPFERINFYSLEGGKVQTLEFPLPEGGRVSIISGHLPKTEYPFLYKKQNVEDADAGMPPWRGFLRQIETTTTYPSWIEIKPGKSGVPSVILSTLVDSLATGIGRKLAVENNERLQFRSRQWLGAIQHSLEQGLSAGDLSSFLRETARTVVDTETAAFCRITLSDPDRTHLKTAALTQVRTLGWSMKQLHEIPLEKTELHKRALLDKAKIDFDQRNQEQKLSDVERSFLLPDGVVCGTIIPILVGDRAVGLLTIGEMRGRDRVGSMDNEYLFVADLANVISLVLTWHHEKRVSREPIEGPRKLTFQKSKPVETSEGEFSPRIRSRLNGPLAGILASCEYLKDAHAGTGNDFDRFLKVIERNALKIQDIAAGISADKR